MASSNNKNSPVDDDDDDLADIDEFFGEDVGMAAIPDDMDYEAFRPRAEIPACVEKILKEWIGHQRLISVSLNFAFKGRDGLSNWVTHDMIVSDDLDLTDIQ